jgi:hypothetical protein
MLKVKNFYNKNQFVIEEGERIIFQSYESIIAIYESRSQLLILGRDWDYSRTTTKHLYLFINDYVCNKEIEEVKNRTNKREYIQKLINNGIIKYDENLV